MLDETWMQAAIQEALQRQEPDWPFGAVIVKDGYIIGRGHNKEFVSGDGTQHAELQAVAAAGRFTGHRHLHGCTLYTTHEPCTMCTGAILNAKIPRVVIGSRRSDLPELFHQRQHNIETLTLDGRRIQTEVVWGVLREECLQLFHDHSSAANKMSGPSTMVRS